MTDVAIVGAGYVGVPLAQVFAEAGSSVLFPQRIGWHELYASDWEKSFAFYAELFGWATEARGGASRMASVSSKPITETSSGMRSRAS